MILIISCNTSLENSKVKHINLTESSSSITKTLIGENLSISNIYDSIKYPSSIHIIDTFLIIQDRHPPFFRLYGLSSNIEFGNFGEKGKGPGEFLLPRFLDQFKITENTLEILIYDINLRRLYFMDLYKIISKNKDYFKLSNNFVAPEALPVSRMLLLNDNTFSGFSLSGKGRLFFNKANSDIVNWIPYFPEISEKDSRNYPILYNSIIKSDNSGSKVISIPISFPRIDVFDVDGKIEFSIELETTYPEPYHLMTDTVDNNMLYFTDLRTNSNGFYTTYNPLTINQRQTQKFNTVILNFNWDGNLLKKYNLDRRVDYFVIDEKYKRIIGYKWGEESDYLYQFKY